MCIWFDSHCHINPEKAPVAKEILAKSREEGVMGFLIQGTSMEDCDWTVSLAEREEGAYAAAGLHPHVAVENVDMGYFRALWELPKVVAVGEIGLDYFYDYGPRNLQRKMFAQFLNMAAELKMPAIIHCRDAFEDCYAIIADSLPPGHPFVIHSFTGTVEECHAWLNKGAMISVNGMVTFRKSDNIRASLAVIPMERLLLETDSPYLAPVPFRGQENTPAKIPVIGRYVAEQKCLEPDEVARITTANTARFLGIPEPQKQ